MTDTNIKPFAYDLPKVKIAARPVKPYDSAKLLVLDRGTSSLEESIFSKIGNYLGENDVLVFNNTKVNKARLFGTILGREKQVELLLLKQISEDTWQCLARPVKNLPPGTKVVFNSGLKAEIKERISEQVLEVIFSSDSGDIRPLLEEVALMPIPPYIRDGLADSDDEDDYQSLFAENSGSIAAPTASLHFTPELIRSLEDKKVGFEFLTLHIGMSSVRPLWDGNDSANLRNPGEEFFIFDMELMQRLLEHRANGKRIIAVGTTVVRALESMFAHEIDIPDGKELIPTSLFIKPGFKFQIIDALITNFHFPASTHLLLVQALIGEFLLRGSYDYALENDFRFLSYGDGMLIL